MEKEHFKEIYENRTLKYEFEYSDKFGHGKGK